MAKLPKLSAKFRRPDVFIDFDASSIRECKSPARTKTYIKSLIHFRFFCAKCTMGVPSILFNLFKKINDPKIYCDKYVRFIHRLLCAKESSELGL